jgi:hypothetical protein
MENRVVVPGHSSVNETFGAVPLVRTTPYTCRVREYHLRGQMLGKGVALLAPATSGFEIYMVRGLAGVLRDGLW